MSDRRDAVLEGDARISDSDDAMLDDLEEVGRSSEAVREPVGRLGGEQLGKTNAKNRSLNDMFSCMYFFNEVELKIRVVPHRLKIRRGVSFARFGQSTIAEATSGLMNMS